MLNALAHVRAALRFLELADSFSVERDPLAKSEMLWCAAAHIMKAIAVTQRPIWPNRRHRDLFGIAVRIESLWSEAGIEDDFKAAERLHRNMYEGFMGRRAFANAEGRVRRLVNRMVNRIQ
ncbi:MAG: hypothetical protein F4X64_13620 [Chloroflexi bacterium]|nr:hypothetical protein [Chloroflexota bacterium]